MTCGVLLFANNNATCDYLRLAELATHCVHKFLEVPVAVVTDKSTLAASDANVNTFDQVILAPSVNLDNIRTYRDGTQLISDQFINGSRCCAYELSPFDETVLMDTDYMVMNNMLSSVWGSPNDIMVNEVAINCLTGDRLIGRELKLSPYGINMVWATVVYFRKTEFVHHVFDLMSYIRDNWDFFRLRYGITHKMYRNDFSMAIALHIMNGHRSRPCYLPIPSILTSLDGNVVEFESGTWAIGRDTNVKFTRNANIHVMNKYALLRNFDNIVNWVNNHA